MVSRDRPIRFSKLTRSKIRKLLPSPQPKRLWALFATNALDSSDAARFALIAGEGARAPSINRFVSYRIDLLGKAEMSALLARDLIVY